MQTFSGERTGFPKNKKYLLADLSLWKEISGRRIDKCRFLRHQLVENIMVDYLCHEKNIVILISPSNIGVVKQKEEAIYETLQSKGYTVLRFDYNSILNDIENVISLIKIKTDPI